MFAFHKFMNFWIDKFNVKTSNTIELIDIFGVFVGEMLKELENL
jgi:hypothetical protein